MRFKIDYFLAGLILVVLVAAVWPAPGVSGGLLHLEYVTTYGICIVFFLYGLTLAPEKMKAGLLQWKLHVCVQVGTFVVFPLVVLAARALAQPIWPENVWLGFFYVAALPSTVSSSVAMTFIARGNVAGALFNASLSSLLGVFLTPLLMTWYMNTTGLSLPLGPVILKIMLLVLVPIVAGQISRRWLGGWAARNGTIIKIADRGTVLAIVYNSFSDSVEAGVWSGNDLWLIAEIAAGAIALFWIVYLIMQVPCRLLGFDLKDRIACLFCASKKSLATGAPLAKVIFGNTPALGVIIAPIMLFHFLQLVMVSFIAGRLAKRPEEAG